MKNQILRKANILGKLAVFALVNSLLVTAVMGALPNISVNFEGGNAAGAPTQLAPGDVAGVVPLGNWNNINGNNVHNAALNDDSAAATGVTIFFDADESWGSGTGTGTPDAKLFNGYLGISNDGHYRPVFLNNVPDGAYKLLMYNVQDGRQDNAYTVNADTTRTLHITHEGAGDWNGSPVFRRAVSLNAGARDVGNYVQFDEIQPIGGIVTIDCRSEAFRGILNGIQLVALPAGAFRFVNQPLDFTVASAGSVTFIGTSVDGVGAVTYQWYTNGVADTANTTTTYTRSGLVARDTGRTFQLVATDSTSQSTTSRLATLIVPNIHFTSEPADATVVASLPIGPTQAFTCTVADGDLPPTFTWYTNGVVDPTVTTASYTRTNIGFSENGRTFQVVATDAGFNSVTSRVATLTVLNITSVNSASSLGDPVGVYVTFSKPMDPVTALDISRYGIPGLTISSAVYFGTDSNVVRLAVNTMTLGVSYTVTVTGVLDQNSGPTVPDPGVASFTFGVGITAQARLTLQRWDGDGNFTNIKNKINTCVAPQRNNPALPSAEYGTNPSMNNTDGNTENYGAKIYGMFSPPISGNYVFGFAADDNAELYLSTDNNPANKVLISQQSSWGGARDFITGGTLGGNVVVPLTAGIPLVAGKLYYLEGLMQEGGGGDHVSIAVRTPGGPAIVDGPANVIPASMFANSYSMGCPPNLFFQNLGPVAILNGAQSQTVLELATTTLQLVLDGTPAYNVQWYSNGVPVPGATGVTYTFNPLRYANGAVYHAVVENAFSSATSASSTITVVSDEIAPVLVRAVEAAYRTNASVVFNEPVGVAGATTVGNYSITNSTGAALAVTGVILSTDGKVATLTTAPQAPGETYCIVVNNIVDRAGVPNSIAAGSVACFTANNLIFYPGNVLFRAYDAGGGTAMSTLRNYAGYPNSPDFFTPITGMNSRLAIDPAHSGYYIGDARENYGATIAGHFIAPSSGNWIFYTSSDDDGALDMNTNGPAYSGKSEVRFAPGCCRALTAGADPTAPIALVAGQAYYIEALYKEGGGGDYVSVGARLVGDNSTIVPIDAANLAFGFNLITTLQPTNITVVQNHTATFVVGATVGGAGVAPLFQWQRSEDNTGTSFTNIPGATAASYSYFAPIGDDQIQFRAIVYLPNLQTNTSDAAILTVVADDQPPAIASIRALSTYKIQITFTERLQALGATIESGNYVVDAPSGNIPVTEGSVVQSLDQLSVVISLGAALPCDLITVTVYNATDEAGNFADISGTFMHYLPFGMKHRYAFNNNAGSANGGILIDSVGTGDGVVQGNGASFTGTRFVLPGGGSGTQPFGDLPNYMVSTNSAANGGSGKVTVEGWVKVTGNQNWSRIFDFGDSLSAEVIGVGGGGEGKDYFFYSAQVGTDVNTRQTEVRNETAGPAGGTGGGAGVQHATTQFNQMAHFAVTWDEAAHLIKTYENGILVSTVGLGATMDQLNDVNVWLGRSAWNGDSNLQGEYDEFRVYDRIISTAEMAANIAIGPDNNFGTPLAIRLVIPNTNVFELYPVQQAQVYVDFSNASNVNMTVSRCFTLSSGNPSVITVDPDGSIHTVGIGDSAISVTLAGLTDTVVVSVNADVTAPSVVSVQGVRTFNAVKVKFSEPVDPITSQEPGSYVLTDTNLNEITVGGAVLGTDGMTVTLSIPTHAPGETYILTVYSVTDLASGMNEIVTSPITFKTWVLSCGFVYFEAFLGLSVPDYQNPQPVIDAINSGIAPSFSFYTNQVYWPQSSPDMSNYGMHFRGLFRAPTTGSYKFEPANDDSGNLLFSTDATEANATLAMDFDCCSGFGSGEAGYTVNLVAGNSYFFDLRVVEAGGGDIAGLAVTLPSGQYLAPIPAQFLAVPTPPNGYLEITGQSASASVDLLTGGSGGATYVTVDFNATDEGFVASSPQPTDGPWTYDNGSGSWKTAGQSADNGHANTAMLTSPSIPVPAAGDLLLTFAHRYSFEGGEWDGGQVRYSINGSPFYTVPAAAFIQNGYNGTVLPNSSSSAAGQSAFVNESAGHGAATMITSICSLGHFNLGDTVQVQLVAASDSNSTGNQPVWEITSGSLTAGAAPFVATYTVSTSATNAQDGANPPRFYQWNRDTGLGFAPLTGANAARYLHRPCIGDNGAQFDVKVSVVGENAVASTASTLTVSPTSLPAVAANVLLNGDVVVTWQGPFTLEESTTLVDGGTVWGPSAVQNGVPFTPGPGNKFYRLGSICTP